MPMESYKAPLEPEELEAIRQQIVKAGSRPICSAPPANRRAQAVASSFIVGQREAAGGLMKDASRELHRLHRLRVEPG